MKLQDEKTITPSPGSEAAVSIVRLAEAEYGSLDTEKLARVSDLLTTQAEKTASPHLLVDLSAVHYFGASFIGILVNTWDQLLRRSRRLVLCGLTPYCSKLIQTLHLDKVFEIYPTQRIALEEIGCRLRGGDGAARAPCVRIQQSEVAWNPGMVRLEYIGDDNVPIRSIIVPRTETS